MIILEILIALWLASGVNPALSWFTTVGFFLVTFLVAVSIGLSGVAYCPCFGRMHVSPWWAVSIDTTALIALFLVRPGNQSLGSLFAGLWAAPRQWMALGLIGLPVVVLILPQSWLDNDFMARLRGEQVRLSPFTAEAGSGSSGDWAEVEVTIKNDSAAPIQVMGGTADCSCVTIRGMPVKLASGESQTIPVRIRFVGTPGRFVRKYFFYTDSPTAPYLSGLIAGRVSGTTPVKPSAGSDS